MSWLRHGAMTQRNWNQMEALFGASGGAPHPEFTRPRVCDPKAVWAMLSQD
jgi:hypothetical protein